MTGGTPHPINITNCDERDWVLDARCRGVTNPDMWFPSETQNNFRTGRYFEGQWSLVSAKAVCMECPVRNQCLQWALEHDEEYGIWGGLTVNQRHKIRKGTA